MKCTSSCTIRYDSRTQEEFCYNHGTVTFTRSASDKFDNGDNLRTHDYSDKFLFNATIYGTLGSYREVAKELDLDDETVRKAIVRYASSKKIA